MNDKEKLEAIKKVLDDTPEHFEYVRRPLDKIRKIIND